MKKIYDEIYGYINLSDKEVKIVDLPEFQRLRRIKQTSLAYLVYPDAMHTRFSHSLGTFHLSSIIGEKFVEMGVITSEELKYLKLASLLHDIGQFPFTHSLEPLYIRHGISTRDLRRMIILNSPNFQEIFDEESIDKRKILEILDGRSIISSIIDSDADVDRMDYLVRDSRHTGVQLGNIDLYRLLDTIFYGSNGEIIIQNKGIYSLENFYISRLHMYQAVYYHKTIIGYELLLREILRLISECCDYSILDPKVIKELVNSGSIAYWDDNWAFSVLYDYLYSTNSPEHLRLKIKSFLDRKGPKVVYEKIVYGHEEKDNKLEDIRSLLEKSQIPPDSIYPLEEKIRIIDKSKIKILDENREKSIKDSESTLISNVPEILTIRRVYIDYEYVKRAREVLS